MAVFTMNGTIKKPYSRIFLLTRIYYYPNKTRLFLKVKPSTFLAFFHNQKLIMSTLKATYVSNSTNHVIKVPLDASKPLTASIIDLQGHVNTFLTKMLEDEKKAKQAMATISTVEQDEREQEQKEMNQEEDEEPNDSSMSVDRPETEEKQTAKKQKTDT